VDAEPIRLDVRDRRSIDSSVAAVEAACGALDVLVNAAGVNYRQPLLGVSEEALRTIFEVNVIGLFMTCQAAARGMVRQGFGRIVNISSIASGYALGDRSAYEASKAAVDRITRSLARELAPAGVLVNAVAPGLFETRMTLQAGRRDLEERTQAIPAGRLGDAEEVAAVVTYLATAAPSYLTGAVVPVDGGRST
jgi:NAD(P)-dependent dehydrogenase (short-subunit alcohol dehydrogenase family)